MKAMAAFLSLSAMIGFYLVMVQNSSTAPTTLHAPDWIYARI